MTLVYYMYEGSETTARCVTDGFHVEVGLHVGVALRPLLFAAVMDRLTDEIGHESLWRKMFADDTVICSESGGSAVETRVIKASGSRTECMCSSDCHLLLSSSLSFLGSFYLVIVSFSS